MKKGKDKDEIKESINERASSFFELLKEFWTIIVFIPVLIGGIPQVIILFDLNNSFVRQFSVTQSLKDGIFSLFFVVVITLTFTITIKPLVWVRERIFPKKKRLLISRTQKLYFYPLYFVLSFFYTYAVMWIVHLFFRLPFLLEYNFLKFCLTITVGMVLFELLDRKLKGIEKPEHKEEKNKIIDRIQWKHIYFIYSLFLIAIFSFLTFENTYLENVGNVRNVYCYVKKQRTIPFEIDTLSIVYHNDTHIYIELLPKDKKREPEHIFVPFSVFYDFNCITKNSSH
ncbi:hypothetical protein [Aquimarina aggregata]|uniref:hypothetical protein n=1 Tax=Aquimarina aggregata TaxID=1642818 RepID=UPI002492D822|nr:hypothetical protein [Aquimarina aggregata]